MNFDEYPYEFQLIINDIICTGTSKGGILYMKDIIFSILSLKVNEVLQDCAIGRVNEKICELFGTTKSNEIKKETINFSRVNNKALIFNTNKIPPKLNIEFEHYNICCKTANGEFDMYAT